MPRIRGVSRTQVQHPDQGVGGDVAGPGLVRDGAGGSAAEDSRQAVGSVAHDYRDSRPPARGRTIWGIYVKDGSRTIRADSACTMSQVKELYEAKTGKAVPNAVVVQAGGFGRYYDAQDSARPVDFDFTEAGEVEEDEGSSVPAPEVEGGDASG